MELTIDQQIKQLEQLKLQQEKDKTEKFDLLIKSKYEGKYFKFVFDNPTCTFIKYIHVREIYSSKVDPYRKNEFEIRFKGEYLDSSSSSSYSNFINNELTNNIITKKDSRVWVDNDSKFNVGYTGVWFEHNQYPTEVTEEEFKKVKLEIILFHNEFKRNFNTKFKDLNIDTVLTAYNFINKLQLSNEDIKNLYKRKIETTDFYPFVNNQVSQIILRDSKRWCKFNVTGTTGNSDYEPYTTGYVLTNFSFDWKEFLYPIRDSLISVKSTAEQLQNIRIYLNDWTVDYDNGSYDAYFNHIELSNSIIDEINEIIKSNFK